jgi:hypothetical protein
MCDARHTATRPENLSIGGTRGSGRVVFNASRAANTMLRHRCDQAKRDGWSCALPLMRTVRRSSLSRLMRRSTSSERLVVAAQEYLEESRFVSRAPYKKMLTASFVSEFAPCGTLNHSLVHDYAISLCRDRPSQPNWLNPGVAVTTPQ